MVKVAVSLLPFRNGLEQAVQELEEAQADMLHWHVMDEGMIPHQDDTIRQFGPATIAAMRTKSTLPFLTHLLIERPLERLGPYAAAGSDVLFVHFETDATLSVAYAIREHGRMPGIAFFPDTEVDTVFPHGKHRFRYEAGLFHYYDYALVLTYDPRDAGTCNGGFRGLGNLRKLNQFRTDHELPIQIVAYGALNSMDRIETVKREGADVVVVGSFLTSAAQQQTSPSRIAAYRAAFDRIRG